MYAAVGAGTRYYFIVESEFVFEHLDVLGVPTAVGDVRRVAYICVAWVRVVDGVWIRVYIRRRDDGRRDKRRTVGFAGVAVRITKTVGVFEDGNAREVIFDQVVFDLQIGTSADGRRKPAIAT